MRMVIHQQLTCNVSIGTDKVIGTTSIDENIGNL